MEEWRDVPGYEGLYMVSNLGNIKSCEKTDQRGRTRKEKLLKPSKGGRKGKYQSMQIRLCKNGIGKMFRVHRIVADAFIPNPDNLPEVNHKDENPLNNKVENLEWCTRAYNMRYGTGRIRAAQKNAVKLKNRKDQSKWVIQLSLNNEILHFYPSQQEASRETGLYRAAISACCRGVSKTHGGFIWKYA